VAQVLQKILDERLHIFDVKVYASFQPTMPNARGRAIYRKF
jgi:hypothetical protein